MFSDHVYVKDCKGKLKFEANQGKIRDDTSKGTDAQYHLARKDTENSVIISDFSTPVQDLVRISMKEPCNPFPPFCQQMGMWNWLFLWKRMGGRDYPAGLQRKRGQRHYER